ncbi:MAG: transposase [bacterium]|nr:transposase [bacterium]
MIRKSTISLKFANTGKLEKVKEIAEEYQSVVNLFIDSLWEQRQFSGNFVKDTTVESWLSARLRQAAAKQALSIVKSQRKKKKKTKPVLNRVVMELDSRFVDIKQAVNSFDIWIKLSSIGNKITINLPSQKHFHFNHFIEAGWIIKKSIRLRITENGYFVDIFFEKPAPPIKTSGGQKAIDIGYKKLIVSSDGEFIGDNVIYEKIARKKQGSKAFKRALIERNELVNVSCKALDLDNVKELFAEDLKNVKHKTKGKICKKFNNKLQRWTYRGVLDKLSMLCEETGVIFKKVPSQYTSQRCSQCGRICKSNRRGETYKCSCGLLMDSDLNASKNILFVGAYGLDALQPVL